MGWKTFLASITGPVDKDLLLRKEYRVAENRMLRKQITGRVRTPVFHRRGESFLDCQSIDSAR